MKNVQEQKRPQAQKEPIKRILTLDIRGITEEQKSKLRGAIKYFSGDRNNIPVQVVDESGTKPCGTIYLTIDILQEFEEIYRKEYLNEN